MGKPADVEQQGVARTPPQSSGLHSTPQLFISEFLILADAVRGIKGNVVYECPSRDKSWKSLKEPLKEPMDFKRFEFFNREGRQ